MTDYTKSIFKNFFSSLNVSGSGLSTQRKRLDMIALNLANVNTIKTEEGTPYRRRVFIQEAHNNSIFDKMVKEKELRMQLNNSKHMQSSPYLFKYDEKSIRGVKGDIHIDPADFIKVFDPTHPEADDEGYILKPNINVMTEMVDMIAAQKEYEANITAINAYKSMVKNALNI